MLCPNCQEWQIMPSEIYCSNCGKKVISFELYLEEKIIYADINDAETLTLFIKNTGFQEIIIKKVDSNESWITIPDGNKDIQISSNNEHELHLNLNLEQARRGAAHKDIITGKIKAEGIDEIKEIAVKIYIKPEIILRLQSSSLQVRRSDTSKELEISLELKRGALNIVEIASDQEWLSAINFEKKNCWLQKGDTIPPITANVNLQALDNPQKGKLKFKLIGREGWLEDFDKEFELSREILPELSIISENRITIAEGKKKNYSLILKNVGKKKLEIFDVRPEQDCLWLIQKTKPSFILEGDEEKEVRYFIDTSDLKPDDSYQVTLNIKSNCCVSPIKKFELTAEIKPMESYKYCIGIDFGTTNSCCAYYDEEKKEIALIPLDIAVKEDPYVLPSLIVYKGIDGKYIDYNVGHDAETESSSKKYAANFVESIKRKLGQEEKRPFRLDNRVELLALAPWEIARDIIKYMLDKVESHLKNKKIENCVICHPGRFSAIQVNDLRKILKNIGIEECLLIDEASAAAMEYIHQRHKNKDGISDNYTLAVFDFGGGTV